MRDLNDADVQDAIHEATIAACHKLDPLFPGFDDGGIDSNFAGMLDEAISSMLQGKVLAFRNSTPLTKLVTNNDEEK